MAGEPHINRPPTTTDGGQSTQPQRELGGTAERGPEKVERGRRWGRRKLGVVTDGAAGKRSAIPNFYPYRTRISSHI